MRNLIIILTTILTLSGCQLIPKQNALVQNGNTITNSSLDIAINTSEEYTYQGQYHYEQFHQFSDSLGGTVHVGNVAVYQNAKTRTFIAIHKKTCNHRCKFSTTSKLETDEYPTSFWVSGRKIFKRSEKMKLSSDSDINKLLTFNDVTNTADEIFNTSSYTSALKNSYFEVLVASPLGVPMLNIKDVVTLSEI